MDRWPVRLLCVVFLIVAGTANAAEVRIHRAEEFTLPAEKLPATEALRKPGSQARTPASFHAFGRTFALELEDNAELLARLPSERRQAIAQRAQLYGGRLQGQANSWLRLTRIGPDLYGLIFDGKEFYSVAPRRTVEPELDAGAAPPGTANSNLIYRASDMDVDLGGDFCKAIRKGQSGTRVTGDQAFKAMIGEIAAQASAAAGLPTREIEVGLLGDLQFYNRQGVDSEDALLARFNIVDGIYSEQVDLRITVGYLRVFTGGRNPFTTNDSEDLLDELAAYRESNATLQAFGLTHLVTGRPLDGSTVGLGFIEGVCDPYFGTSLSEDMGFDVTLSAFVAAHELGHNFGAEHDTERGSPCQATPDGYLMAPAINDSGWFSDCSLQTMEPVIRSAACIFPTKLRDAELGTIQVPATTTVRAPVKLVIPIRSIGTDRVDDVRLSLDFAYFGYFPQITSLEVPGGQCGVDDRFVICKLGSMQAGETRWATISLRSTRPQSSRLDVRLTAQNDGQPGNDQRSITLKIVPRVDVSIRGYNDSPKGMVAEPITSRFTVTASGYDPAEQVVFRGDFGSSTVKSVTANAGRCVVKQGVPVCMLGAVPTGEVREISVSYAPTTTMSTDHRVWITALHDDARGNEDYEFRPNVQPRHALRLTGGLWPVTTVGEPATLASFLRTIGPLPIEDTSVTVNVPQGVHVESVTAQSGQCHAVPESSAWVCEFALIASETSTRIDASLVAELPGRHYIHVSATSPNNDDHAEPYVVLPFEALPANDMALPNYDLEIQAYDQRDAYFTVQTWSTGLNDERNVGLKIALPEPIAISSVEPSVGSCVIDGSNVFCSLGTLPGPNAIASVVLGVKSAVVGEFTGTANVVSANDDDLSNNKTRVRFRVSPNINVSVKVPNGKTAVQGELFQVPVVLRTATSPVRGVRFRVVPQSGNVRIDSVNLPGYKCEIYEKHAVCPIGSIPAGSSITAYVRAHGTQVGSNELRISAWADTDVNPGDNDVYMPVNIVPAPPP